MRPIKVVHRDNVRMLKAGDELGFGLKVLDRAGISSDALEDDLNRHIAVALVYEHARRPPCPLPGVLRLVYTDRAMYEPA